MISNTLFMFTVIFMIVATVFGASYCFMRSKGSLLSVIFGQDKYSLPKSKRRVKGHQKKGKVIKKACVYDYANDIHSMAFKKPSRIMRLFDTIRFRGKGKEKGVLPKYREVPSIVGTGYERIFMEPICFTEMIFGYIKKVSCSKVTNFVNKFRPTSGGSNKKYYNRNKNNNMIPLHKGDLEGSKSFWSRIKLVYLILSGRKYKIAYELELNKNLQLSRERDSILKTFNTSRANLEGQVTHFKTVLISKEKALKNLRTQKEETEKKIVKLQAANDCLKAELDASIGEKKQLQQGPENNDLIVKQYEEKVLNLSNKVNELNEETEDKQVLICHLKYCNSRLENENKSMKQDVAKLAIVESKKEELILENKDLMEALEEAVYQLNSKYELQKENELEAKDELDANHVLETVHELGTTQVLDTGAGLDTDAGLEATGELASNDLSDTNDMPETNLESDAKDVSDTNTVLGTNDLLDDKEKRKFVATLETIYEEDEDVEAEIYGEPYIPGEVQINDSTSNTVYNMDDLFSVSSIVSVNSLQVIADAGLGNSKKLQSTRTCNLTGKTLVELAPNMGSANQRNLVAAQSFFKVQKGFVHADYEQNKENYDFKIQEGIDQQTKFLKVDTKTLNSFSSVINSDKLKVVEHSNENIILDVIPTQTDVKVLSTIHWKTIDPSYKFGIDVYSSVYRSTLVEILRCSQNRQTIEWVTTTPKTCTKRIRFLVYCKKVKQDWKAAMVTLKIKFRPVNTKHKVIENCTSSVIYNQDSVNLCLPELKKHSIKTSDSKDCSSQKKFKTFFQNHSSRRENISL